MELTLQRLSRVSLLWGSVGPGRPLPSLCAVPCRLHVLSALLLWEATVQFPSARQHVLPVLVLALPVARLLASCFFCLGSLRQHN